MRNPERVIADADYLQSIDDASLANPTPSMGEIVGKLTLKIVQPSPREMLVLNVGLSVPDTQWLEENSTKTGAFLIIPEHSQAPRRPIALRLLDPETDQPVPNSQGNPNTFPGRMHIINTSVDATLTIRGKGHVRVPIEMALTPQINMVAAGDEDQQGSTRSVLIIRGSVTRVEFDVRNFNVDGKEL